MTIYAPRVKETTTITGTGPYELAGALTGFQGFVAAIGDTETTWYCCTDGIDWEIGTGIITDDTPDTLSRTVYSSSNSDSAVDWAAGSKYIFCIFPPPLLNAISGDLDDFINTDANTFSGTGGNNICIGKLNVIGDSTGCYIIGTDNQVQDCTNIYNTGFFNRATNYVDSVFMQGLGAHAAKSNARILAFGSLNADGDTQLSESVGTYSTTDGTEAAVLTDLSPSGSSSGTGTVLYEISVVARQTGGTSGSVGDSKAWKLDAVAKWSSSVATQIGTTTSTVVAADAAASAWTCALDFAETNPIRVTGEADKTIHWVGYIRQVEASSGYEAP